MSAGRGTTHSAVCKYLSSRPALVVVLIWAVLTAVGEVLVVAVDFFPLNAAEEANIVDGAFRVLSILAVPVAAFVIAMLLVSVTRFRTRGEPSQDGPPIFTNPRVVTAWLAVTVGLTILMIIYPGIIGLNELHASSHKPVDLVIQVEASQFLWKLTYPEQNVTTFTELVLPVGQHVRFDIEATDVVHAFWIPAFRGKVDAVPGLITHVYATPSKTGSFEDDSNLRLQCAELCGVGHAVMRAPVRVVEQAEFDAWVSEHRSN